MCGTTGGHGRLERGTWRSQLSGRNTVRRKRRRFEPRCSQHLCVAEHDAVACRGWAIRVWLTRHDLNAHLNLGPQKELIAKGCQIDRSVGLDAHRAPRLHVAYQDTVLAPQVANQNPLVRRFEHGVKPGDEHLRDLKVIERIATKTDRERGVTLFVNEGAVEQVCSQDVCLVH